MVDRDVTDRHLRAVGDEPVADTALLAEAAEACVTATPGGIAPRALRAAVAGHLGVGDEGVPPESLTTALGLLIATGRLDEVGGRLVAVVQERREAG